MEKTIALDLGTNSVGWAIRANNSEANQLIDAGVLTFEKGVAEVKGIEQPKVSKRTEMRGKRRNYQARKYRKQALLALLIEQGMCPLTIEELNRWRKYESGRRYPEQAAFQQWFRLDFNGDGVADYNNPYILRAAVAEGTERNKLAVGRALYHLTQRRGFSGGKGENPDDVKLVQQGLAEKGTKGRDEIKDLLEQKTLGQVYAAMLPHQDRIRNRYNLRSDVANELQKICNVQNIGDELYQKLHKAIIWQRPLRTQKGNVGMCLLEKGKKRCQVSHPDFELFRAFSLINNIKMRPKGSSKKEQKPLTDEQRDLLLNEVFFRKKPYFDFIDIRHKLDKANQFEFNYKDSQNIAGCPVSAGLKGIFGDSWREIKVQKPASEKAGKNYYDLEDIWHVLVTFVQQEHVLAFATEKLKLPPAQAEQFVTVWKNLPSGYGSLSLAAIKKILPLLKKGQEYSNAVMMANLEEVFAKKLAVTEQDAISNRISKELKAYDREKEEHNIVNALIADHLDLPEYERFGHDERYEFDEQDKAQIENQILKSYGEKTWQGFDAAKQATLRAKVSELYLNYLRAPVNTKKFIRTQRRDERVKNVLSAEFGAPTTRLERLYHHSDNAIYPAAERDEKGLRLLGNPSPPANGFKNPMAIKTLYKLKYLINYLLQVGKIDEDTKVIVEVPRELTTANKRKAIETWQIRRQKENMEFARAIIEINKEKHLQLEPEDPENVDKFRLWFDQLENRDEVYKNVQALKTDIERYRLWKEQKCQCMYTGKAINITDIFSGKFDFEHTVPASMSFDDSLANLTICDAAYNRQVKKKRIPTELPNYYKDTPQGTAIWPRLLTWEKKVEALKEQIKSATRSAKFATTKESKDAYIQRRHYYELELEYWQRKLNAFVIQEFKAGWRNSQLVDTGIVSKYALHYLKTVFEKVYVQKGEVTAIFRKIYGIQAVWDKKSRDKHSHHAVDAAVLTLIPTGHQREKMLQKYFEAQEQGQAYHIKPYPTFQQSDLKNIEQAVLINFLSKTKALVKAKKYTRIRGKKVVEEIVDGVKKYRLSQGDSVRGQLHEESFFGAIKMGVFENGKLVRSESGAVKQEEKEQYVIRKELKFGDLGFTDKKQLEKIVDPVVRQKVIEQVGERSLKEAFAEPIWMNKEKGIKIRHVRVFKEDVTKPLKIKKHRDLNPTKEYKHYYYAKNATNLYYLFYEGAVKGELKRIGKIVNLFTAASLNSSDNLPSTLAVNKKGDTIPLRAVLKVGQRVLFYKESPEELEDRAIQLQRLYVINNFEKDGRMIFNYHLDARTDNELREASKIYGNAYVRGFTSVNFKEAVPRLRLSTGNLQMLIEKIDFEILPDGTLNLFK